MHDVQDERAGQADSRVRGNDAGATARDCGQGREGEPWRRSAAWIRSQAAGAGVMSQLSPFVRAFRALADSCVETSKEARSDSTERGNRWASTGGLQLTLAFGYLGSMFDRAATDLEQQIARDLARPGSRSNSDVTAGGGS